jgi:hypothetical protein
MNVIENSSQDQYVPWLICMDSSGDNLDKCDQQAGVSKPATTAPADVLQKYLQVDSPIQGTPTVYVNGKDVKATYAAVKKALCKADSSLSGCSSNPMPEEDDKEIEKCMKPTDPEV